MPINLDRLAMAAPHAIFGRAILVHPAKSQPGEPPYEARGVPAFRAADMALIVGEAGVDEKTLSLRLSQFPIPPVPGDYVTLVADPTRPELESGVFYIEDVDADLDGHATLSLIASELP